jgi:hypothetical protein
MNSSPAWAVLLLALAACSSRYTVPVAHVTNAKAALTSAGVAGAAESARGRAYLLAAEHEFQLAMGSNGKDADLLLLRSQVDAELALALAREDTIRAHAQDAVDRAHALSTSQPRQ